MKVYLGYTFFLEGLSFLTSLNYKWNECSFMKNENVQICTTFSATRMSESYTCSYVCMEAVEYIRKFSVGVAKKNSYSPVTLYDIWQCDIR